MAQETMEKEQQDFSSPSLTSFPALCLPGSYPCLGSGLGYTNNTPAVSRP